MDKSDQRLKALMAAYDLRQAAASDTQLKSIRGGYMQGRCPICKDKQPTLFVSKESWKCFACGKGGNLFAYMEAVKGIPFEEAVNIYSGENITLREQTPEPQKELLYELNMEAKEYFRKCLHSNAGRKAQSYLRKRGVEKDVMDGAFQLGYAPVFGSHFYNIVKSKYPKEVLDESALFRTGKDGKVYDRFFCRIMFPFFTPDGKVAGFGGRVLDNSDPEAPKYYNTSDTAVFKKGSLLYGFRNEKAPFYCLCEGNMDVIAMRQAGFTTAVASCGTSFTKEQAELIKSCLVQKSPRHPDARQIQPRVYILFDMDDAGRKACVRAARTLRSVGITARVVQYADAKDPDEFLKAFGADAMKERLRRAVDADLFELVSLKDKNGDTDIRAIASLLEQMDATKRRSLLDQAGTLYRTKYNI